MSFPLRSGVYCKRACGAVFYENGRLCRPAAPMLMLIEEERLGWSAMSMDTAALLGMALIGIFAVGAVALALWTNRKPHAKGGNAAHPHST